MYNGNLCTYISFHSSETSRSYVNDVNTVFDVFCFCTCTLCLSKFHHTHTHLSPTIESKLVLKARVNNTRTLYTDRLIMTSPLSFSLPPPSDLLQASCAPSSVQMVNLLFAFWWFWIRTTALVNHSLWSGKVSWKSFRKQLNDLRPFTACKTEGP